jgi:hypothetical protein
MIQAVVLDDKDGDEYAVIAYPVPVDALKFSGITQVLPHASRSNAVLSNEPE